MDEVIEQHNQVIPGLKVILNGRLLEPREQFELTTPLHLHSWPGETAWHHERLCPCPQVILAVDGEHHVFQHAFVHWLGPIGQQRTLFIQETTVPEGVLVG